MPIIRRRLPIYTFQRRGTPDPYIALSIRHPVSVPKDVSWGKVLCKQVPGLGEYLPTSTTGTYHPFVDFWLERPAHPLECHVTRMEKLRIVIKDYNRDHERMILVNGGTVFALADLWLNRDLMEITEFDNYPITIRGAYEPHPLTDERLKWDPGKAAEVVAARARFERLLIEGYRGYRVVGGKRGSEVKAFDPAFREILMTRDEETAEVSP